MVQKFEVFCVKWSYCEVALIVRWSVCCGDLIAEVHCIMITLAAETLGSPGSPFSGRLVDINCQDQKGSDKNG